MLGATCTLPYAGVYNVMTSTKLTKKKWLITGLGMLAQHGPNALKAEPLSRALQTTKGSFYWHFKDVPAFQREVLELWSAQAVGNFVQHLAAETTAPLQLRRLGQPPESSGPSAPPDLEAAVRAWGSGNHTVANAITEVDAQRTRYLAELLKQLGVTDESFAVVLYGAWVGLHIQKHKAKDQAMETLVDLILALR